MNGANEQPSSTAATANAQQAQQSQPEGQPLKSQPLTRPQLQQYPALASQSSTVPPMMAGANGNGANSTPASSAAAALSTLNKKRKKEGLKPIITTEGPGPV
ncbi:hypothetical protein DL771_004891 [Monosporascus sp. 5C6A]|nr:hypothetical protein DL771_004891 [Monosporascus sp. 5C6A]